jgi:hypothetical protein
MSVYVGIDVHRKRSQVAVVAEDGTVQLNKNVVNGSEPMLRLIGDLRPGTPVAFEAAFGWGWLVQLLEDYGFDPHLVHPLRCKAIASARLKTDKGRRGDPGAAAARGPAPGGADRACGGPPAPRAAAAPGQPPVGALRVVRWSARYEETVTFYRDIIGLPVLETFHDSYGLDGTILGLPGGQVHLEIVRAGQASYPGGGLDQLVFYLPDAAARERMQGRLAAAGARPVARIDYWQANGGVTYQDPDGREVMFASWIYSAPGS